MTSGVGQRLKLARERAGLDIAELAVKARVASSDVEALEQGRPLSLTTAAIARLARVLDLDVTDLMAGGGELSSPALFFKQAGVPDFFDRDRKHVVHALEQARSIAAVDTMLGRTYLRDAFAPSDPGQVPHEDGYKLANRVRRHLGNLTEPLGDLRDILEEQFGVPVLEAAMHASGLLAVTVKERATSHTAVILSTNAEHFGNVLYERVDLAHELAHVLFDAPGQQVDYWIDLADETPSALKPEQRAKAFAAELLIPRAALIALHGQPYLRIEKRSSLSASIALAQEVADRFSTPPDLTVNHLVNNGFIDQSLREAVPSKIVRSQPPARPARPPMLHRRLAEGLASGLLTQMRARELLGLSAWDDLPSSVLAA
jgi:transcriptional regulator with XRE-family HTH domain